MWITRSRAHKHERLQHGCDHELSRRMALRLLLAPNTKSIRMALSPPNSARASAPASLCGFQMLPPHAHLDRCAISFFRWSMLLMSSSFFTTVSSSPARARYPPSMTRNNDESGPYGGRHDRSAPKTNVTLRTTMSYAVHENQERVVAYPFCHFRALRSSPSVLLPSSARLMLRVEPPRGHPSPTLLLPSLRP